MKTRLLPCLLVAGMLAACGSDKQTEPPPPTSKSPAVAPAPGPAAAPEEYPPAQAVGDSCSQDCGGGKVAAIQCAAGETPVCDCAAKPDAVCQPPANGGDPD